jgi:hypothetical protein
MPGSALTVFPSYLLSVFQIRIRIKFDPWIRPHVGFGYGMRIPQSLTFKKIDSKLQFTLRRFTENLSILYHLNILLPTVANTAFKVPV